MFHMKHTEQFSSYSCGIYLYLFSSITVIENSFDGWYVTFYDVAYHSLLPELISRRNKG